MHFQLKNGIVEKIGIKQIHHVCCRWWPPGLQPVVKGRCEALNGKNTVKSVLSVLQNQFNSACNTFCCAGPKKLLKIVQNCARILKMYWQVSENFAQFCSKTAQLCSKLIKIGSKLLIICSKLFKIYSKLLKIAHNTFSLCGGS